MANFNLDRIRFKWRGTWVGSTVYTKDDIVLYNGKTYVCLIGHTANADNLTTDLANAASRWELMFDGQAWKGDWTESTYYTIGDIVKFEGYVYQCTATHTSTFLINLQLPVDIANWTIVATTYNWLNKWLPNTYYDLGDVIRYNGITYICNAKHDSASTPELGLETEQAHWTIVSTSDFWTADWRTAERYKVQDIVKYGGIVYRCITAHTSDSPTNGLEADQAKWEIVVSGIEYKVDWSSATRYKLNDIVKYGPTLYMCTTYHSSTASFETDNSNWQVWMPGSGYEGVWNTATVYSKGDIVLYGGYTYTALTNNTGQIPSVNGIVQDTGNWELLKTGYKHLGEYNAATAYLPGDVVRVSGFLYVAFDNNTGVHPDLLTHWTRVVTGHHWKAEWVDNQGYELGDVVTYAGVTYTCVARHTGVESDNRPDLDILNEADNYWTTLIQGTASNVLTTIGDIRTFGISETERLAIGAPGNIIKGSGASVSWQNYEVTDQVYFVSIEGVDIPTAGKSLNSPFRTIKYACEYVESNPQFSDVFNGQYVARGIMSYIVNQTPISTTAPNFIALINSTNPRTNYKYWDLNGDAANPGSVSDVRQWVKYYNKYIAGTSLVDVDSPTVKAACDDLWGELNRLFSTFSGETFVDTVNYDSDTVTDPGTSDNNYALKRAVRKNTTVQIKTGIYQEIIPIKVPRDCALVGDELRSTNVQPAAGYEVGYDMFRVNNGSGIRNMTLQGLTGTLPLDGNEWGTRIPTGGAFVTLDPGTGPEDTSVWITNKSPYVQNVTTFGTACIGMKIDGTYHNGGNKSVVANDFTQVISDGIGYWANEAGRSELVSVFTYYCYIGYWATNGGILRATNGNNSYGTFGSRSEGYSLSESPITADVNNQTLEAQVKITHTNGSELIALGYEHAGQGYSTATGTVTGTGINASLNYDEFRDKAISQIRVLDPADSSTPGGLNYQYLLNSAQGGDDTRIQLAAADTSGTAAKYVGMRIVIVAGKGIGQYAKITAYDDLLKYATVSKECNDTNGWENLYPGRPIETTLDTTTRYSIEPTVEIDDPGWTPNTATVSWPFSLSSSLKDIKYVNGTYVAINGDGDTGISTDGLNFTASTSVSIGGNAPGGFYTSTTSNTAAYFLSPSDGVIKKYTQGTGVWSTITLPSQAANYFHLATDPATETSIAIYGNQNGWSKTNGDGTTQSAGTFSSIAGGSVTAGIAYGNGIWVVLAGDGDTAYSTDAGSNWTQTVGAISGTASWGHIVYGNGRFVAVGEDNSAATAAYSFDGITWYRDDTNLGLLPNSNLGENSGRIIYHNGEFIAWPSSGSGSKTVARSKDGWAWTWFDDGSSAYTITNGSGLTSSAGGDFWVVPTGSSTIVKYTTGAKALARVNVVSSRIKDFVMYDPGCNYTSVPGVLIVDPENTVDVLELPRINDGVLTQPAFANRGSGYVTATTAIAGNGLADIYQTGKTMILKNVDIIPGPGANVVFNSIDGVIYRLTKIVSQSGSAPNFDITCEISPPLTNQNSPEHEEDVIVRELYSQVRLTGHDFLDIGVGNINSTRYPELYTEGYNPAQVPAPEQEVTQYGGGRVFYTSTDQDGNFRVGELFAVEQNTGIVSINADFFELSGLEELSLGAIQVGGSAVVIREFSKEDTFIANSNNIVPTEKAILSYLESRISGGGADAVTNTLIAGQIRVTSNNISNDAGLQINIPVKVDIKGGIGGDYLAQQFFLSKK